MTNFERERQLREWADTIVGREIGIGNCSTSQAGFKARGVSAKRGVCMSYTVGKKLNGAWFHCRVVNDAGDEVTEVVYRKMKENGA